eukprot:scaffold3351_cov80-Cylindrotheca_fusiformis.AAC.4
MQGSEDRYNDELKTTIAAFLEHQSNPLILGSCNQTWDVKWTVLQNQFVMVMGIAVAGSGKIWHQGDCGSEQYRNASAINERITCGGEAVREFIGSCSTRAI